MLPVDLRSDTVTLPTPAMRAAMAAAPVGDDVFGEDPSVNALEERLAAMFGHGAGLFCASGTMANQIAIRAHTKPGDEVICDEGAHIYRFEGGGTMANSGCSVKLLHGDRGRFKAEQVAEAVNDPGNPHFPVSRLVVVENTANRGGGSIWNLEEVRRIRAMCTDHRLAIHLDGARIFNAMAVDGRTPAQWGAPFDSLSVCLSKGLGAPVGSVLLGGKSFIAEARRVRKRLGGGMRQAGMLAAAGLYALDHHVAGLSADHQRALHLSLALKALPFTEEVLPVETNIVVTRLAAGHPVKEFMAQLRRSGILVAEFGPNLVRMVTHLGIDDDAVHRTVQALEQIGNEK
ncbi:MAG TPA: GntG family PLP-dependent aldolase [Flavobacteriales bacterium]|mgnify:CR=1 FL=1|nr:GntG family PLP-dependent aldolase [Flavobacteriales bacterium]HRP81623.1 GntG family PLP-dependent aldolase [Flavobacteriales bacterium]HRQ84744.1 GntG family PLP-dependent aldolase [Flavobacteriales bacterium]